MTFSSDNWVDAVMAKTKDNLTERYGRVADQLTKAGQELIDRGESDTDTIGDAYDRIANDLGLPLGDRIRERFIATVAEPADNEPFKVTLPVSFTE